MARDLHYLPRIAIFLAGIAAGALTSARRERGGAGMDAATLQDLKNSLANLDARLSAQDSANAERFNKVEARLEEHAAKLAEVPSTAQIVAAMEQLLTKTMASLDDRLSTQAQSIEVLRGAVSQTDTLLERVLESIDSLQPYNESPEFAEDPLLSRPAV